MFPPSMTVSVWVITSADGATEIEWHTDRKGAKEM